MSFDDLVASAAVTSPLPVGRRGETAGPSRSVPVPEAVEASGTGGGTAFPAFAGVAIAIAFWWFSLGRFDLDGAGATGMIGVVPWTYLVAVGILAVLFGWQLSRPQPRTVAIGTVVVALVVVLFSVPNLVDGTGMTPTGYIHAGFIDYIGRHHAILPQYDSRFDWPAFFAAGSVLAGMAGLPNVLPLLVWAPVVFELLALAPMLLLARSVLGSDRTAWLAVVLYYGGSWFAQDYFAPQAVGHLLYLSSMAVLCWTVSGSRADVPVAGGSRRDARGGSLWVGRGSLWAGRAGRPGLPAGLSDGGALAIQLVLTTVAAAMVIDHQLTPLGFIIQLGVLSLLGATRFRAFWLVVLLLFVTWFSYGAKDFWLGHLDELIGNLGQLDSSVNRGLTSRVSSGEPLYLRMQMLRTLWSGLFLLLGLAGGLVLLRRRNRLAVATLALALAPFSLIALQSYGGEIFLRCFLYAMPFLAVLAATALSPLFRLATSARAATVAVVVLVAALGLVTTRGVNVAFERVSPDALAAAKWISAGAPSHPSVAVVETFVPLSFSRIEVQRVSPLGVDCELRLAECALAQRPDQILLTEEQEKYGRLRMRLPAGWLMTDGVSQLIDGAGYRIVFDRPDAVVLQATRTTKAAASRPAAKTGRRTPAAKSRTPAGSGK